MKMTRVLSVVFSVLLFAPDGFGEDKSCPHHAEHQKQVNDRGDHVMGFDHEKTVHHFELKPDGGVIRAEAKDAADTQSIDGIRKHFVEISALFAKGDFSMPMAIHDRVPPGVAGMKTHRKDITYSAVEIPNGGEVRIKTENAEALKSIHEFLRFQIEDHQTGDPLTLSH